MGDDNTPAGAAGLCETCRHSTVIQNDRGSRFFMCERSRIDERFPRYPRLPLVACVGYTPNDIDPATDRTGPCRRDPRDP